MLSEVCLEVTGASYVKISSCVPATAPTVNDTPPTVLSVETAGVMHCIEVDDDHDAVRQESTIICIVAVRFRPPKLRPLTVIDASPHCAELR
jgi:hypothetical protein